MTCTSNLQRHAVSPAVAHLVFVRPMLLPSRLVHLLAVAALLTLASCGPVADAEIADQSLMALLSRTPRRERLPDTVRISSGNETALFSDRLSVHALNRTLGEAFVSSSNPAIRPHTSSRKPSGQLAITVGQIEMKYTLARSTTDPNLWAISIPDRHHPSSGLLFFLDDGSFTRLLREYARKR